MYQIIDRGYDREYRFCCKVPADTEIGERIMTTHGPRLVYSLGRPFHANRVARESGEPPAYRYAYVDISADELGAPVDALTPEQAAYRERSPAYRMRRDNDAKATAAILAALERDGWSNQRNTPGISAPILRRVYRELVEAGALELDGYRYVPRRNT